MSNTGANNARLNTLSICTKTYSTIIVHEMIFLLTFTRRLISTPHSVWQTDSSNASDFQCISCIARIRSDGDRLQNFNSNVAVVWRYKCIAFAA